MKAIGVFLFVSFAVAGFAQEAPPIPAASGAFDRLLACLPERRPSAADSADSLKCSSTVFTSDFSAEDRREKLEILGAPPRLTSGVGRCTGPAAARAEVLGAKGQLVLCFSFKDSQSRRREGFVFFSREGKDVRISDLRAL